mgnify:CR=1 FL=1
MNCTVEDRDQARRVIQELGERSDGIGTDLVSPAINLSGSWTIGRSVDVGPRIDDQRSENT